MMLFGTVKWLLISCIRLKILGCFGNEQIASRSASNMNLCNGSISSWFQFVPGIVP